MYANTASAQQVVDRMQAYGVRADGEVVDQSYHAQVEADHDWTLAEVQKAGGQISRVRILSENMGGARMCDISYVHATIPGSSRGCAAHMAVDGGPSPMCSECNDKTKDRTVRVSLAHLPQWSLIPKFKIKGVFIEWAKAEHVFAKGLGLLDDSRWSVLY